MINMPHVPVLSAQKIAEYFVWKGQAEKQPITNKKLQKLLYYAQAWSLVVRDQKLFKDKIEAWVHGPAVRDVYLEYKRFGFNPIDRKIPEKDIESVPSDVKKFLDEVSLQGQPFVKDPNIQVSALLAKHRAKVLAFTRFEVGEGIEKISEDFVEAVMSQVHGG